MPHFSAEAVDPGGKKVRVDVEAGSTGEALTKLKQRGYKPLKIGEKPNGAAAPAAPALSAAPPKSPASPGHASAPASAPPPQTSRAVAAPPPAAKSRRRLFGSGRVKAKQLAQFTGQLSVLMDAGLPIVRSLKILSNQQKPGPLKNVAAEVAEDVETGSSFSEALGKHPKTFNKLYVNMVKAGEAGGVLDVILQRLAGFLERIEALKRRVIGAVTYPAVVIVIALVVVFVIMTYIVPQFESIFQQVGGGGLPALTQMLMNISNFCVSYWYILLMIPPIAFTGIVMWGKTAGGRLTIDRVKLSFPLIGIIIRKSIIARFCRTLGTLLQSGVPILDALNIVRNATGNEVVGNAISKVHDSIREGESIAEPLGQSGVFDDIVINMIDVGEETGELDKMLLKVSDTYDAEVDTTVGALMSIMEPILIVGLGVTVGFIVVALFLPLVELLQRMNPGSAG